MYSMYMYVCLNQIPSSYNCMFPLPLSLPLSLSPPPPSSPLSQTPPPHTLPFPLFLRLLKLHPPPLPPPPLAPHHRLPSLSPSLPQMTVMKVLSFDSEHRSLTQSKSQFLSGNYSSLPSFLPLSLRSPHTYLKLVNSFQTPSRVCAQFQSSPVWIWFQPDANASGDHTHILPDHTHYNWLHPEPIQHHTHF